MTHGVPAGSADAASVLVKALAGGSLVVLFALLSESLAPKRFAGLFGAAPAVAIAGLAVTLVSKGTFDAKHATLGIERDPPWTSGYVLGRYRGHAHL